jgi:hypothetical protein
MLLLRYGWGRWRAPRNIETLVEPMLGGSELYWPRLLYLLIDEGRYTEEQLAPLHNVAVALFRLENSCTPTDVQRVVAALVAWLHEPAHASLRRAFHRLVAPCATTGAAPNDVYPRGAGFRGGANHAGRTSD